MVLVMRKTQSCISDLNLPFAFLRHDGFWVGITVGLGSTVAICEMSWEMNSTVRLLRWMDGWMFRERRRSEEADGHHLGTLVYLIDVDHDVVSE